MTNVMVDLETLGTDSNSVIISISAVAFDLSTGKTGKEFEVGINLLEQALNGGIIDTDTIKWWASQDEKAKKSLTNIKAETIEKALEAFNKYLLNAVNCESNDIKLWGNGSGFDNVLIRNLYRRSNIKFALPYWCDNDVRTLVTLANINTRNFEFKGIKHNGIDDCKHQINYCVKAYGDLK